MKNPYLRAYAQWILAHAKLVVGLAFFLTLLSVLGSVFFLKTKTGILDMYAEDTPVNKQFIAYIKKFGAVENLILVFEGGDEAARRQAMDQLAARLQTDPHHYLDDLFYKVDINLLKAHAFQFLSESDAKRLLGEAQSPEGGIRTLFAAKNFADFLSSLNRSIERGLNGESINLKNPAEQLAKAVEPVKMLRDYLKGEKLTPLAVNTRMGGSGIERKTVDAEGYLRTDDQKMHVMFLRPEDRRQDYKIAQKMVAWVRDEIQELLKTHPEIKIGVTGGPALNSDQFRISEKDMRAASIFAFLSTGCLFFLAFRRSARPFFGLLTLALSLSWAFGFTTLAIGHLNLFSMAFIVILVGQGTYYGVHVVARYEEELKKGLGVREALEETIVHVFGNITTSTLTTAAAFFATTLVKMKGFADLGWIAGTGVILSSFAMQSVLPAFLMLHDRRKDASKLIPVSRALQQKASSASMSLGRRGQTALSLLACGVVGFALWGAYRFYSPNYGIAFDHNLLNLQAKDTEAVRYEKKLIETSLSPRAGIFMATSLEQARDYAEKALKLPSVQRVEWIGSVFPEGTVSRESEQKLREAILQLPLTPLGKSDPLQLVSALSSFQKNLDKIEERVFVSSFAESILPLTEQGHEAASALIEKLQTLAEHSRAPAYAQLDADSNSKPDALEALRISMPELKPEEAQLQERLGEFQELFLGSLRQTLLNAAQAMRLKIEDLPRAMRDQFVSADQHYAIYAYPKVDIWQRSALQEFVTELRSISPDATGPPIMFFEILNLIQKNYFHAAYFSALAIFLIFLLDFRSLRYALLASLPLLLGVFALFGFMSYFQLPLNTANMIALPMILGIGADNGVHMIHRFLEEGKSNISFIFRSTGKALLITYIDSVTSFIGLTFANHQGLAQLGKVVVLGITCCTVAGFLFLPAVMLWIVRSKKPYRIP